MENQRSAVGWRIHPPPPPHLPPPAPPSTQGFEDQKFGESQEISQEGTSKNCARARWNHQMKAYLIELLKDHDVPKYRMQNACSKEAWTNIVDKFNQRFNVSFTVVQVKQKEQDLKRDFKVVKGLVSESGFGWDRDRKMVVAPDNVWATLEARKNKDALIWREKSFPYYEDLFALYDGRYAEGRSCRGMDYYVSKATQLSRVPTSQSPQLQGLEMHLHAPTPTIHAPGDSSMRFDIEEDIDNTDWFSSNNTFSQVEANSAQGNDSALHAPSQVETMLTPSVHVGQTLHEFPQVVHRNPRPSSSAPEATSTKRAKRQKTTSIGDFHERYLQLKREEIDRYTTIQERKLRDPFSIKKCINELERLDGLLMAVTNGPTRYLDLPEAGRSDKLYMMENTNFIDGIELGTIHLEEARGWSGRTIQALKSIEDITQDKWAAKKKAKGERPEELYCYNGVPFKAELESDLELLEDLMLLHR
ncbi:unnamed protein product [Triticum turgidum subsp. durum]|uniref:Myb/SANT-like domain-containing protein n=1 Tax=Triticum turgidum subsp. durum TaxID=4567 RepID=A0A9R1Q5M8_TRITD|nr:unnamed protein product [Triticum turgidum subsp. durum]